MPAIEVLNLSKSYGPIRALDDISFQVETGEIFGFLGPNGAGKTTTFEIMAGLRNADKGSIIIDGKSLKENYQQIKEIIGVQLQSTSIYDKIKVYEVLKLFAGYYKNSLSVDYILDLLSLNDKKNSYFITLSGGQQQRVTLGLALVNDPKIIFLDEPSAGIDPQARRNLWEIILKLKEEKRTVILSTHYMDEAQKLCDRVAIIDKGKIIDIDKPQALINKENLKSTITINLPNGHFKEELHNIPYVSEVIFLKNNATLFTHNPIETLSVLMEMFRQKNVSLDQIIVKEPNLEDLFLELTGRDLRE